MTAFELQQQLLGLPSPPGRAPLQQPVAQAQEPPPPPSEEAPAPEKASGDEWLLD